MKTNPNDPAFMETPDMQGYPYENGKNGGLTKREYFAAMAAQGIIGVEPAYKDYYAKFCVEFADALVKALNEDKN